MALGTVAVAALPASADTGTATITGTGTISPGLTQAGDPSNSFTFGGTGVAATTGQHDAITCTVSGNDTIGSWTQGAGSFSGNCNGAVTGGASSVAGTYTRTGSAVTVAGTATKTNAGGFSGNFNGACAFSPTNVDPNTQRINAFTVHCTFTIGSPSGTATITGSGTISPGLTQAGDPSNTFTFGGTGVAATTTQHDVLTCTVAGNDTIGSWLRGSGSLSGNCNGAITGGASSVSGNYTRTGSAVTVSGTATATNSRGFSGSFNGACAFTPTNLDPNTQRINAFAIHCTFTIG